MYINSSQSKPWMTQKGLVVVLAVPVWTFSLDDGLGKNVGREIRRNEVPNGDNILSLHIGDNVCISPFGVSLFLFYQETFVAVES
ncbi:MAG: hypothetical protein EZS28_039873 [Streblomastix strix]|uniref:Uncharacterized protein n=1 Tax=Streblomastix strix TaxID=222440 RepID=A0A5J4U399_9EUKA|nr:MAG: hypothetical protein EZS28_039873 [Streblomastix strix]